MEGFIHHDDYNASFRDTVWLQSFPLNQHTVLHYFALSPFYDRTSNNEKLKMQKLEFDQLKHMRGVEYEYLPTADTPQGQLQNFFLVRKQYRTSPTEVRPLALYYILDGTVYQAPNIRAILLSRLEKCSFHVNKAFNELEKGVEFGPSEGYAWDFSTEEDKMDPIPSVELAHRLKRKAEEDEQQRRTSARIEGILVGLVKKYMPDVVEEAEKAK